MIWAHEMQIKFKNKSFGDIPSFHPNIPSPYNYVISHPPGPDL